MDKYTPTTEEVRKRSRMVRAGKLYFKELRITDAEFDRWLAEVIRKAKSQAWTEGAKADWNVNNPYWQGEE